MRYLLLLAMLFAVSFTSGCESIEIDSGRHHRHEIQYIPACPNGKCPTCPNGQCPREGYTEASSTRTSYHAAPYTLYTASEGQIDWAQAGQEVPSMNLAPELRQHNWTSTGSCVFASTVSVLRWQGQYAMADYFRATYSGGESLGGLADKLDKNGLYYAYTSKGDPAFLEWCDRTRRGAVLFYFTNHCINFVGKANGYAYLLDNNHTEKYLTVEWSQFIHNWHGYGGMALTPLYSPPPPMPVISTNLQHLPPKEKDDGGFTISF